MKPTYFLFLIPLALFALEPMSRDYLDYPPDTSTDEIEKFPEPVLLPPDSPPLNDLEDKAQSFVLATKKIELPGYPDAFNPCIVRWRGSLLMSFRIYDRKKNVANKIGLVWLDENFDLASKIYILDRLTPDPLCIVKQQDPRLIVLGDKLYIAYANVLEAITDREIRRMVVAEVHFENDIFYTERSDCFVNFKGANLQRSEKNWVPFEYEGKLLLAYSLIPHRILHPLLGTEICDEFASSLGSIKWEYGVLRGGTPAIPINDDEYLAFFHSSKSMVTTHSLGKSIPHYVMGAYTFSRKPPFTITRISPKPIVGKNFYHGKAHKTWKPLVVVFASGLIIDDDYVYVLYGRQDHECWVAKLDKQALLQSMVPVPSVSLSAP